MPKQKSYESSRTPKLRAPRPAFIDKLAIAAGQEGNISFGFSETPASAVGNTGPSRELMISITHPDQDVVGSWKWVEGLSRSGGSDLYAQRDTILETDDETGQEVVVPTFDLIVPGISSQHELDQLFDAYLSSKITNGDSESDIPESVKAARLALSTEVAEALLNENRENVPGALVVHSGSTRF